MVTFYSHLFIHILETNHIIDFSFVRIRFCKFCPIAAYSVLKDTAERHRIGYLILCIYEAIPFSDPTPRCFEAYVHTFHRSTCHFISITLSAGDNI